MASQASCFRNANTPRRTLLAVGVVGGTIGDAY
jgi:hypothetical protein